ncbi:MAG: hypothetical protein JNL82_15680 [Myxococcales bacterium]|nr:hypothetical protein [Myxococcales bacterium]
MSKHVLGLRKYIHDQTGNPRTGYVLRGPEGTRIKSINRSRPDPSGLGGSGVHGAPGAPWPEVGGARREADDRRKR